MTHLHGNMGGFVKLIRWQNLIIVIFTMILMRYFVIEPLISKVIVIPRNGTGEGIAMVLQFKWFDFIILVASTVFITAGGYVINDYFDIKTDLINRGNVIVGTKIPRQQAMLWHSIFNVAGVAGGFYVSWKAGYFWMGILFLLVSGLLYFYSASYKRQFLVGNLLIAFLTAMVPMLVIFYEWPALYRHYSVDFVEMPKLTFLFYWIGGFALFAFLTTLAREIIKDIEDFEGDQAYGRNTLPVIMGIPASKTVAVSLVIVILAMLYIVWFLFVHDIRTLIYLTVLLALPLFYIIYLVAISKNKMQLHLASNLMKFVMLIGILYSLLVKVIITWNLV